MKVRVLFFASLRDRFGCGEQELELGPGSTLSDLGRYIGGLDSSVAFGLNQELREPSATLKDGDEVALLPPVSGG